MICFEKKSGNVKWHDNSPGKNLLDVQHGSPLVVEVHDEPQVIMGQGDGWMRGFNALTGQELWKFDINSKSRKRWNRSLNQRNDLVAMPVYHEGRVFFATGRQHEMCDGPGRLCCLDPTRRGDISSDVDGADGTSRKNPNSGLVWEYLGKSEQNGERLHDAVASVAIHYGLVYCVDAHGVIHCVDASTGEGVWIDDSGDDCFASPLILKDRVFITRHSSVDVFALSRQKQLIAEHQMSNDSLIASPSFANGTLFVLSRRRLYAIAE